MELTPASLVELWCSKCVSVCVCVYTFVTTNTDLEVQREMSFPSDDVDSVTVFSVLEECSFNK